MKNLIRVGVRSLNIVNRSPRIPESSWTRLPLFESRLKFATETDSGNYVSADKPETQGEERELYTEMTALQVYYKQNNRRVFIVQKASFVPEANALELRCLDPCGEMIKKVEVPSIIPVIYYDFVNNFPLRLPFPDHVDIERIFKKRDSQEWFFFLKDGEWNAETANHPKLDFRNLFDEDTWFEKEKFNLGKMI